ncbi:MULTISPECIES: glutamine-hydrolyzing carbamoyl-phosphate synthase small subunit [Allobaculum]|uniref:glutamine-hydrolyzing carbamoyl-phosphate synthase small subunit n=1 Tax=Allobaculum TaxID=174708 RepID=UPI001E4831CC|nr:MULTISPECIES: glutamine-hydrolyzing carbamoyl-phosphate synthase small subunit [Allobaculum]UNT93492.1 glutamine-hydrolyzing carbamoyl-phosphate synthase small subunit [Allobaculum sp. Allo2]
MEDRLLILEDGSVWKGKGFGSDNFQIGELVFNTSMTGYQEILTDNSYCGQIILMTYPLIGNYGVNRDDWESIEPAAFGFVVKNLCDDYSNWRACESLDQFCKNENIPGISEVDTRALTRRIREHGTMRATMANVDADVDAIVKTLQETELPHDQVKRVSSSKLYSVPNRGPKVILMDFGAKLGIVRELSMRGCDIVVVPYNTDWKTIMNFRPDGVMLTNGPGNPEDLPESIETIRNLIGKVPIFGICLGHQLIALACGAKTYKLKFGHRGGNHPVVDLEDGHVEITSQNHGYAVDKDSLKGTGLKMTHVALNDKSCEGMMHTEYPVFSLQFHPEANAGPNDSKKMFDRFMALMEEEKEKKKNA